MKDLTPPITMVLDKFEPINDWFLESFSKHISYIKIGWGLPMIVPEKSLRERIEYFHSYDIPVSVGGTLFEYFIHKGMRMRFVDFVLRHGFDIIEISHGSITPKPLDIQQVVEQAVASNLFVVGETGKKTPWQRLTREEIKKWIELYRSVNIKKIIVEGREWGINTCIYDEHGKIIWNMVRFFKRLVKAEDLIFEAPLPRQQVELIRELGPDTGLGNVKFADLPSVVSVRKGLRGDLLVESSLLKERYVVSTKFVLLVLRTFGPLSLSELQEKTGLSKRTLRNVLKLLHSRGLIEFISHHMAEKTFGRWLKLSYM
ncbi:MAG: phosphosulfolactate synthase [Candidatus Asgardarchaeia archaeon]